MRHLFRSLAAAAALCLALPGLAAQEEEAILIEDVRRAVAELRAEVLRPGEHVEGWDRGGADPPAAIRALGAENHYYLTRSSDGTYVGILTDRPIRDFAPPDWEVVDSYGSADTSIADAQVDFIPMSARYVMATRTGFQRLNDAYCADNFAHALLFEVPGAPDMPDDDVLPMLFRIMILALEDQMICVRADGDPRSGYRSRYFRPDGRELPELAAGDELSFIVPAAPVDELIEPPAAAVEEN